MKKIYLQIKLLKTGFLTHCHVASHMIILACMWGAYVRALAVSVMFCVLCVICIKNNDQK